MSDTNPWLRTIAAILLVLLLPPPVLADSDSDSDSDSGPPPPPTATVVVDCDKPIPDSINEALTTPAVELTVEIRGICDEFVKVTRSNVILRGATQPAPDALISPLPDGIHFTGSLPIPNALFVRDTFSVTIENLSLTSRTGGLSVGDSFSILVSNCRLENSGFAGAFVGDSRVTMVDTLSKATGIAV